jgi:lysophospholipase L1-like esterase
MYKNINDVPPEKWQELSKKKIYFGHQSVGYNIIEGIQRIMADHPEIQLNIIETRTAKGEEGAFMHSRVGENRKPETKINDFLNVINQELGVTPDAAALKFCFVDAYDKIDEQKIFQEYKEAMGRLRKEHPGLTIIHFTMPLRTQKITWKTKVKLLLGKEPWELEDNIKRNQFNKLLLQEYLGKEPVFDIAGYEGTSSDGEKLTFTYKGARYISMRPEYSSDGGHLNVKGEQWIAENFLLFLVQSLTK